VENGFFMTNMEQRKQMDLYSIQHYVIKFVSDLGQVGGFIRVLSLPPPMKLLGEVISSPEVRKLFSFETKS
jgi:hypothetical protein